MAGLLPSTPDTSAAEEVSPRVIGMDSDDAEELLTALSSETARALLAQLHEDPAPPSVIANRVDTSIQNAQYHLNKLRNAGLIEVIDTCYSEKGREMNVFAPADRPLVVIAGPEEETTGLRSAISRVLGAIGVLGLASLVVEELVGEGLIRSIIPGTGVDDVGDDVAQPDSPQIAAESEPSVTYEAASAADVALGFPPGLLFFAGGLFILACVVGYHWYHAY